MKFFKHFVDSADRPFMQELFKFDGHRGLACYWLLVELCTNAMDKKRDEVWTEADCKFVFHERVLRQKLRVSQETSRKFLGFLQESSEVLVELDAPYCRLEFPKLLESLHRDAKRTRPSSGSCAPKKEKEKKKEKKDAGAATAGAQLEDIFREYPRKEGKSEGIRLGEEELRTEEDFSDLRRAVKNYAAKCQEDQTEHAFIKTFASFMREWRDWTDPRYGRKPKPNYSNEAW